MTRRGYDLTNKVFGRLTVIKKVGSSKGHLVWLCKCECGNYKEIPSRSLRMGNTSSCGCLAKESAKNTIKEALKTRNNYTDEEKQNWIEKSVQTRKKTLYEEGISVPHLTKEKSKRNKSGVKGVCWDKSRNKWKAEITLKGKLKFLGRFDDIDEAINARKMAEEKYFAPILKAYEEENKNK